MATCNQLNLEISVIQVTSQRDCAFGETDSAKESGSERTSRRGIKPSLATQRSGDFVTGVRSAWTPDA